MADYSKKPACSTAPMTGGAEGVSELRLRLTALTGKRDRRDEVAAHHAAAVGR